MDLDAIINNLGAGRRGVRSQLKAEDTASRRLSRWWVAERMAPTLLHFQAELLDEVVSQIRQMVAWIEENSLVLQQESDLGSPAPADIKIRLLVVETELERVKFVARNYIRARLTKIDRFLMHFTGDASHMLSASEIVYARRHLGLLQQLYERSFLGSLPPALGDLDDESGAVSMVDQPTLDAPVVFKVTGTSPGAVQVGQDLVELQEGGVYMLRFSAIVELIGSEIELV